MKSRGGWGGSGGLDYFWGCFCEAERGVSGRCWGVAAGVFRRKMCMGFFF